MFFCALLSAYRRCYSDLNAMNRYSGLQVKHKHEPKLNDYIRKVVTIRDISIVHMGNPDDKTDQGTVNWIAATLWNPVGLAWTPGTKASVENLELFSGNLEVKDTSGRVTHRSIDLQIKGVQEMDRECHAYLSVFDSVCADYLMSIGQHLPMTANGVTYSWSPTT